MRQRTAFAAIVGATCALATMTEVQSARACGGCFHPPPPPTQAVSDITDERMLLSVSTQQTTLYDQIRYSGTPSQFAWVLPIKGTVTVGLSADVLFDTMDALTTTQINAPPLNCPSSGGGGIGCGGSASSASSYSDTPSSGGGAPAVTVTKQENVGPYETVQLHSVDPKALTTWLSQNGFVIPGDVATIIDAYVGEGFDFLAMRLLPDQGILAMRPVRVTMSGAALSLPLRMAAIGTGASVGITLWVVADGRYEPQNFPFFHIDDKDLVWDWNTSSSNYSTLRKANELLRFGRGWEIESSINLNTQVIENAILSGGVTTSGGGVGYGSAASADGDYLPIGTPPSIDPGDGTGNTSDAGDGGDAGDAGAIGSGNGDASTDAGSGPYETAEQVRNDDLLALLNGATSSTLRVTRIRSDVSHAAMTTDLVLQASSDQSELSNIREVSQSANKPDCPSSGGSCDTGGHSDFGSAGIFIAAVALAFTRIVRRRR